MEKEEKQKSKEVRDAEKNERIKGNVAPYPNLFEENKKS